MSYRAQSPASPHYERVGGSPKPTNQSSASKLSVRKSDAEIAALADNFKRYLKARPTASTALAGNSSSSKKVKQSSRGAAGGHYHQRRKYDDSSSESEEEIELRQRKVPQKSPTAYDRRAAYQKLSGKNPAFCGYDKVQSLYYKPGGAAATEAVQSKVYTAAGPSNTAVRFQF